MARVGVTESHRKPEKDRERASKSLREQQRAKEAEETRASWRVNQKVTQ